MAKIYLQEADWIDKNVGMDYFTKRKKNLGTDKIKHHEILTKHGFTKREDDPNVYNKGTHSIKVEPDKRRFDHIPSGYYTSEISDNLDNLDLYLSNFKKK